MADLIFPIQQTKQQANTIGRLGSELAALTNGQFVETMQAISATWKGDSASLFLKKGSSIQELMNRTVGQLQRTSSSILDSVKAVELAEEAARAIAERRRY